MGVDETPAGSLINSGLIQAETGNVTLLGTNMTLGGVIGVTTSISTPGSINISTVDEAIAGSTNSSGTFVAGDSTTQPVDRRAGQLIVSGLIANLPEENGQTVPSDGGSFTAGSISLTAGSIWLQNGSLIEAPGASVGLTALTPSLGFAATPPGSTLVQGRVYIDNGATIDVAGLSDVTLPISDILVTIPLIGANELADSPLLRNSFLDGLKNVVIDSTLSGTNADGEAWVGSPLLNASGYVDLIPALDRSIADQWRFDHAERQSSDDGRRFVAQSRWRFRALSRRYHQHHAGDRCLWQLENIGNADPNIPIVGIAGQFTVDHSHWNVTEIYTDPLLAGGYFEPDYIVGGNAGTLSVFGTQTVVLDGAMSAQAFAGIKQIEAGLAPSGTNPGGNFLPQGGSFILGAASVPTFGNAVNDDLTGELGSVIIQNEAPQLTNVSPGFSATTPLDTNALNALGPNDPDNIPGLDHGAGGSAEQRRVRQCQGDDE